MEIAPPKVHCYQVIYLNYIILNKLNRITGDRQLITELKIYLHTKLEDALRVRKERQVR